MPQTPVVLVADSSAERRRTLGLALYEGGYEVINAVNGEEALRFTAGLNPTLTMVHTGLEGLDPDELRRRVAATGLEVPPFLVLFDDPSQAAEDPPDAVYYLSSTELEPQRLLQQVRLLLLGREIGGDLSDTIDVLYGDFTRIPFGDLLRVLAKHVITGHVTVAVGPSPGVWFNDGEVVGAHWGSLGGRKAFNRIAALRTGGFTLTLETPPEGRTIDADLASLVSDALDERMQLEEAYRRLPSLAAKVTVKMGEDFFSIQFSSLEREILTMVQRARNLGELIDRVAATDAVVLQIVEGLVQRGILVLTEPEQVVHVVTDSTGDLLPSLVRRMQITVVPLSVLFGKSVFKDGIDLQPDQFYAKLRESTALPSTSPPTKGEFLQAYRRLIGSGDILSIHISGKLSKTPVHAAAAAADGSGEFKQLRDETGMPGTPIVRVVDSWQTSVGLGMLTVFARRLASRGLGVDEIADRLEGFRDRGHLLFIVDTLEYLQKGGRIGKAQAWLGGLLGIKPILGLVNGEVTPVDRVRGGRKTHARLLEIAHEHVDAKRPIFAAVAHSSAPKWAGRLRELLSQSFKVVEVLDGEIGPVVGTHVGPGCVGAFFFQPTPEELELLKPE